MLKPIGFIFLMVFFTLHMATSLLEAAEISFSGRLFSLDQKQPLANALVRIVNTSTGLALEDKSSKDGCYDFGDISAAAYSFSVIFDGKEYLLPDKLFLDAQESKAMSISCYALNQDGTLLSIQDERCRPCKRFANYYYVLGGAGAVAGVIAIAAQEEEAVSPSRP